MPLLPYNAQIYMNASIIKPIPDLPPHLSHMHQSYVSFSFSFFFYLKIFQQLCIPSLCALVNIFFLQNVLNSLFFETTIPSVDCPYEAPDMCTGTKPQSCCDHLSTATSQRATQNLLFTTLCIIMMAEIVL